MAGPCKRMRCLILPGVPLHVIQVGINESVVVLDDEDRHRFGGLSATCFGHRLHAFAFMQMDNPVHLLLTAQGGPGLSDAMRRIGQCLVPASSCGTGTSMPSGRKSCMVRNLPLRSWAV